MVTPIQSKSPAEGTPSVRLPHGFTRFAQLPAKLKSLARRDHKVAGSMVPLVDCYFAVKGDELDHFRGFYEIPQREVSNAYLNFALT